MCADVHARARMVALALFVIVRVGEAQGPCRPQRAPRAHLSGGDQPKVAHAGGTGAGTVAGFLQDLHPLQSRRDSAGTNGCIKRSGVERAKPVGKVELGRRAVKWSRGLVWVV